MRQYISENELQTWGHVLGDFQYSTLVELNCDGIVEVEFPRATIKVPLEFDAYHKTGSRYEEILGRYYRRDDVQIVFYVCREEKIMNQLKTLKKRIQIKTAKVFLFDVTRYARY